MSRIWQRRGARGALLATVLALACAACPPPAGAATVVFSDLPSASWAAHDILSLAREGVIHGYPDGTVRPSAPVTRAQWTALVYRVVYGGPAPDAAAAPYSDVPTTYWAAPAVAAAKSDGWIVFPTPGGDFGPADPMDRQEAASLLAAAFLGVTAAHPAGPTASIPAVAGRAACRPAAACLSHFSDRGTVAPWAEAALAATVKARLMRGYPDGALRPKADLTRAAAAAILYRMEKQVFVYGSRRFRAVATLSLQATTYGSDEPGIGIRTATGTLARPGEMAVDPSYLPLETYLWVTGYRTPYLPEQGILEHAEDTGGAVRGPRIDLYMTGPPGSQSAFGIQPVRGTVLVPLT